MTLVRTQAARNGRLAPDGLQLQHLLQSQHEVCAFASMVVASLPFPPLPVLVLQGEDGEYGMASSFDLLQQAIIVQQLGCVPPGDLVQGKIEILEQLRTDMTAHYEQAVGGLGRDSICSSLWVERAYEIYCSAFRSYLLRNYASCTEDLRFHHLSMVPADSIVLRQGTSHWKASRLLSGECAEEVKEKVKEGVREEVKEENDTCCEEMLSLQLAGTLQLANTVPACFSNYKQMLRSYAVDLATLPQT